MSAVMMVREDRLDIDPKVWTPGHGSCSATPRRSRRVQRIFVNAAIKKALCREATGDRSWLAKIRPWWGHDYHFHIRMRCPPGSRRLPGPAVDQTDGRRLQACRSRLLVQDVGPASEAAARSRRSRSRR